MKNKLQKAINNLLAEGHKAIALQDTHKMTEPSITITWHNDGSVSGEFYSYCLNLTDGGRHHHFSATGEDDLIKVLNKLTIEAEEELKEIEDIERMENEGG